MSIWVAVIIGCFNPTAASCDSLVRTEAFHEKEACFAEMKQVVDYLVSQGRAAKGRCVQIKTGEAT